MCHACRLFRFRAGVVLLIGYGNHRISFIRHRNPWAMGIVVVRPGDSFRCSFHEKMDQGCLPNERHNFGRPLSVLFDSHPRYVYGPADRQFYAGDCRWSLRRSKDAARASKRTSPKAIFQKDGCFQRVCHDADVLFDNALGHSGQDDRLQN